MKKLAMGVLGCGERGRDHAEAAIGTGLFEFAAAADRRPANLEWVRTNHPHVRLFTDAQQLLAGTRIDVLHVCTQPTKRPGVFEAAIDAGVRAIVVEKPMALSYSAAVALEQTCRAAGVLLVINHQIRNMAEWRALRQAIAGGELGCPTMVRGSSYGNLLAQGSHLFDMTWFVLGETPPVSVRAACDGEISMPDSHPAPRHSLVEVEFSGGVRAQYSIGEDSPRFPNSSSPYFQFNLEVRGTEGAALAAINQGFWQWDRRGNLVRSFTNTWQGDDNVRAQGTVSRDLYTALADPHFKHPLRGEAALVSFAMIEAACRSSRDRCAVRLPLENGCEGAGSRLIAHGRACSI